MTPTAIPVEIADLRPSPPVVVEAILTRDVSAMLLRYIEDRWEQPRHQLGMEREHLHWNWSRKFDAVASRAMRVFAISAAGTVQGAMAIDSLPHLNSDGNPSLYVAYIESAPWNLKQREPSEPRRFHGVGTALIVEAVEQSRLQGWEGCIHLHSLPTSESYYCDVLKMRQVPDPFSPQNLACFEYNSTEAREFLKRVRS